VLAFLDVFGISDRSQSGIANEVVVGSSPITRS
jgi:hypothetical protein